jgi:[ribosomal protein S5]-alanine N-acetyltransferase
MARTQQWIKMMIDSSANGVTDFIICLKPNLVPIGKIGIWQGEEIGFLLARQYWGQGLAREALELISNHLFEKKGLILITADTDPRNAASIGLLKAVGFEEYEFKERTFQIGDEWVDSLYLKLTKEAWSARKPE